MQFKGHLLLPDDTGPGLRVNLDVAEHHLAVESDGGGLGAWPLEVVDVRRRGEVFSLSVAGESLEFVADDTIDFAYTGMPTIEAVSSRRPQRRSALRAMLDRIRKGPSQAPSPPEEVSPAPAETPGADDDDREDPGTSARRATGFESLFITDDALDPDDPTPEVTGTSDVPDHDVQSSFDDAGDVASSAPEATESDTCPALRSDGRRCESQILTSSGYCYSHDPRRAFEDKYRAAHEARAQLRQESMTRLNRIYSRLDKAMRQVERGELDPETAMAMAQIARTMCAIVDMDPPTEDDVR